MIENDHRPIFLVGAPASGKTTFGRALARALGKEFIDLDKYIENRFHTTVNALFDTRGEEGFRQMERSMLQEAGCFEDVVVACGGGTPCFHGNMEWMNANGTTVWLQTTPRRIVERLMINRSRRPMFRSLGREEVEAKVASLLATREPFYSHAAILFPGEELENAREIDRSVQSFLKEHCGRQAVPGRCPEKG